MKCTEILVFGNPDVKKDSLPVQLIGDLQKSFPEMKFLHLDGIDEIQSHGKNLFIIDSVQGIKKCCMVRDPTMLTGKILSIHEFDLANNIKILKKIKAIESFLVFCVPMKISKAKALAQLKELIADANKTK